MAVCSLDCTTQHQVKALGLRRVRRGCRAGLHHKQHKRPSVQYRSDTLVTGVIPVITGNRPAVNFRCGSTDVVSPCLVVPVLRRHTTAASCDPRCATLNIRSLTNKVDDVEMLWRECQLDRSAAAQAQGWWSAGGGTSASGTA